MSEIIKAIITTLDNLPMLEEQIPILQTEGLSEIIVVNNGSKDGTGEWLNGQDDVTAVHCANLGAGPGRNAGLGAAREFDYALMLDGGIRPLRGGVRKMLDYLEANPDVDIISPEIATCISVGERPPKDESDVWYDASPRVYECQLTDLLLSKILSGCLFEDLELTQKKAISRAEISSGAFRM